MNTKPPSHRSPYRVDRKPYRLDVRSIRPNDGPDDADDLTLADAGICLDALDALGPMFIDHRGVALLSSLLNEDGE